MKSVKSAQCFRFSFDRDAPKDSRLYNNSFPDSLLLKSVKVHKDTFPRINKLVEKASNALLESESFPDVFLRSDSELQAVSYTQYEQNPIIVITSGLIERLDDTELISVIGHEIGHWMCNHKVTSRDTRKNDGLVKLKQLAVSRCAEISADRAGLIASSSLNATIRALIKVTTGLDQKNIRFDIQSFLKQYKEIAKNGPSEQEAMSTHPFFLLRIRALVMFSRSTAFYKITNQSGKKGLSLEEVDELINRDLRSISGISLDCVDDGLVAEIMKIAALLVFISDGRLDKEEQVFFKEYFEIEDFGKYLKIAQSKGSKGMTLLLRQKLKSLGAVSKSNHTKLENFIGVLTNNFPPAHTESLRIVFNSVGL